MPDSELREEIAKNIISNEFINEFNLALKKRKSFSFETNLTPFPKELILNAKEHEFRLEIYFFCLSSIALAKERVEIRVRNNGHDVDDQTINYKWKEGYKNINQHFSDFDYSVFIDNSLDKVPTFLFEMEKTTELSYNLNMITKKLPEYTERRLPAIFNLLQKKD